MVLSPPFCLHAFRPCFSRRSLSCPGLSILAFRSQSPSFPVSALPLYFRPQSFPSSTIPFVPIPSLSLVITDPRHAPHFPFFIFVSWPFSVPGCSPRLVFLSPVFSVFDYFCSVLFLSPVIPIVFILIPGFFCPCVPLQVFPCHRPSFSRLFTILIFSVSTFPCSPCSRLCPLLAFSHFARLLPTHLFSRSSSPLPRLPAAEIPIFLSHKT